LRIYAMATLRKSQRPASRLPSQKKGSASLKKQRDFVGILATIYSSMWKLKRKEVLIVVACAVVAAALQAYTPQLLQKIFDGFASASFATVEGTAQFHQVLMTFVLVGIGGLLFKMLAEKTAYYLATQVEDYWRYRGLRAYYDLPISWHDAQDSGEIASRIESGGSAVFVVIYELVGQVFFVDLVTLLFVLPLAYAANPSFFWVLFLPVPIVTTTTYFISKQIAEGQNRLNEMYKQAQKALFDAAMNIRTVKTFAKEEMETNRYKEKWGAFHKYDYEVEKVYFVQSFVFTIMDIGTRGLILLISLTALQSGGASIGQVVLLLSYQQLVFNPFTRLNSLFTRIRRQANRAKVLLRIIDESDKANEEIRPLELGVLEDEIQFKNVSFAYSGKGEAVRNVNFSIQKGSTVALVGRSGAGKTTIAALVAGFYSPTKGRIMWDGDDLSKTNRASISKQVSYVAQDSALFNRSIKANVAYADENATHKEVESAATHAHANEFVMSMTNKYRSVIGEKGVRLSGGQKQRLALARALLASGSLLILDESTSQLDSESERAIQGAIEKLRGKVTQVIIAHRLSTVLHADKIIVMDKGRMVASGTHHELLETSPIYRKLHDLQFQD